MAEPDWFPPDLPELSSEQGPGLLADEQFWDWALWLGNATQMEDGMKLRDIFGLEICEESSAGLPDTKGCKKLKHGSMEKEITGDTNECRRSGRIGTRKRRTSPWADPKFFERHVSREYKRRKNNSRWTAEEVERLVQGVSEFGVGPWTKLKLTFFKTPISSRTPQNLKDKWKNLVKAYEENSSQQSTLLVLEPSLVERIRKLLAAKQRR